MIPHAEIISWQNSAPWGGFDQVEQGFFYSMVQIVNYISIL